MTQRLLMAVVVLPAVLVLAACGSRSTDAQPARTPSTTAQTASEPAAQPDKMTGPAPADQEVDELTGAPAEFVCAGDTVFGSDDVLPYGDSISAGVLRCESADSGITCRDTKTGHGFSIARQAYRLF